MVVASSLQFSHEIRLYSSYGLPYPSKPIMQNGRLPFSSSTVSANNAVKDAWNFHFLSRAINKKATDSSKHRTFLCRSVLLPNGGNCSSLMQNAPVVLKRVCDSLSSKPVVSQLIPAIGVIALAWGLLPLLRFGWSVHGAYFSQFLNFFPLTAIKVSITGKSCGINNRVIFSRALDPMILPSEASQMGFQFAGKAIYTAVWVASVSLFMELLGFSTQRWLTAGGLGTVLLTLAGREIFTNFLSSVMIHATRPFILNEWIQTKIEGYEVSGTVEHVGWWSPTIIRGDDREAVYIPNHKFTVSIVRNLTQKTHWRIKTHLAISHLDVNKINIIVADMRKVLAKHPQIEQQKLHRRVFLDNINHENQALLIMISCFVKTSRFEEYLCVKEAILLDLLRVISHHRARLATPIRTIRKVYTETDVDNVPFSETVYSGSGAVNNHPFLLIEPSYKINSDNKTKSPTRKDEKSYVASKSDSKVDVKIDDQDKVDINDKGALEKDLNVLKKDDESQATSPAPRTALDENIVLGVALEGSKRTLPIEEEEISPLSSSTGDSKELAASRNGVGSSSGAEDKKDDQLSSTGSANPGDNREKTSG
uniref:Uncharacterized protein n=1 Tax=Chenopodium quinoa TaxID=63459 RepID=A0A803LK48_CHEQI